MFQTHGRFRFLGDPDRKEAGGSEYRIIKSVGTGAELPHKTLIEPREIYKITYDGRTFFGGLSEVWDGGKDNQGPTPRFRYDMIDYIKPGGCPGFTTLYTEDGTQFQRLQGAKCLVELASQEDVSGLVRSYKDSEDDDD